MPLHVCRTNIDQTLRLTILRFVTAPSSRDNLKVTKEMFTLALSYFQVMPSYLDFLFSFGQQGFGQDLYFSGFRSQLRMDDPSRGIKVPDDGVSRQSFQLCYNLKAVEHMESNGDSPWALRQCAIHHIFDIETTRANWLLVEGRSNLQRRVTSAVGSKGLPELTSFGTVDEAFGSSLATHILMCEWATENWQWYIKYLDEQYHELNRRAVMKHDATSTKWMENDYLRSLRSPSDKAFSQNFSMPRLFGISSFFGDQGRTTAFGPDPTSDPQQWHGDERRRLSVDTLDPSIELDAKEYTFMDLQRIQHMEEIVHEATLFLQQNASVMEQLKEFYSNLNQETAWPEELSDPCKAAMTRFQRRIQSLKTDQQTQLSRCEMLSRLLADRKSLVSRYSIYIR